MSTQIPARSLAAVQFFGRACKEPIGGREENDSLNPLSPNIHIQILQTDLYTFPLRIICENLIKDQGHFLLGDHFINSHNLIS